MKTLRITLTSLLLVALLAACTSGGKDASTQKADVVPTEQTTVLAQYIKLKDALVQSDASLAKSTASSLRSALEAENMVSLMSAADEIAASENLAAQRTAFKTVTDGLIAALKANSESEGIFVQYCPMAFDNTGASWLSMSNEIRNPYFGDMMLKCGRVTEEL